MEYALAGLDNQLFVSRYQLELPRKEELERLLEAELRERGVGEAEPSSKGSIPIRPTRTLACRGWGRCRNIGRFCLYVACRSHVAMDRSAQA